MAKTIALSFVGTGKYEEVTYQWQEQQCTTKLFPIAVDRFFEPDRLFLVMTQEARRKYGQVLQDALPNSVPLYIPDGTNEKELWEVFEQLVKVLREERPEQLIIDVTHSFRTLPMIALGTVVFFQEYSRFTQQSASSNLEVQIVYGAFEAKDKDAQTPVVPVFDLTGFAQIIRWTHALLNVRETYRFDLLGNILGEIQRRQHKRNAASKPRRLKSFGSLAQQFGLALQFTQPLVAMQLAHELVQEAPQVRKELQQLPELKPLLQVFDFLVSDFQRLSVEQGDTEDKTAFLKRTCQQQIAFLRMLEKAKFYHQLAVALREFLITAVGVSLSVSDVWTEKEREQLAEALNTVVDPRLRGDAEDEASSTLEDPVAALEQREQLQPLKELWQRSRNVRNKVAHAGMGVQNKINGHTLLRWAGKLQEAVQKIDEWRQSEGECDGK